MGHIAWNKGKNLSEETKRKIKLARKKQLPPMLNKHHSTETKRKISLNHCGGPRFGHITSEESKKKMSLSHRTKELLCIQSNIMRERRKKIILPIKDTSIEIKIQNLLKQLKIEFEKHKYINIKHGYQVDIFVPSKNLVIECYGNYWHKHPTGREIDIIRCQEMRDKGYKVLILWESEIKVMELNDLKYEICQIQI